MYNKFYIFLKHHNTPVESVFLTAIFSRDSEQTSSLYEKNWNLVYSEETFNIDNRLSDQEYNIVVV